MLYDVIPSFDTGLSSEVRTCKRKCISSVTDKQQTRGTKNKKQNNKKKLISSRNSHSHYDQCRGQTPEQTHQPGTKLLIPKSNRMYTKTSLFVKIKSE